MPAPILQFKRGNAGVAGTVPALRPGEPAISLNNFDFFVGSDSTVTNNKFFGSHRYWGRENGTTSLVFKLVDRNGANSINLKSPNTLAGITTYTFPETPINAYVLTTNATGDLSWTNTLPASSFSGITTYTDTTNNTLGNADTGAVQIDGGLGINRNVTVGGNLNVQGYSEFVGVVTFRGGTINIGDSNTDNINVSGEFISSLTPNDDNSYDIGIGTQRWRNANFAGVVTATSFTGTATTATRATTVDTTTTSVNQFYSVPFVTNFTGTNSETIRVGTGLSVNPSNGNAKSAGDLIAGSGYLDSANGTRSMFMFDTSGDVSFQGKIIENNYRSSTNANNTLTFSDLDATFARNLSVVGVATVGTAVSTPTIRVATIQQSNGTQAATIDSSGNITASQNLTVSGNLFVNGSTTQVNTDTLTVEDRTIELGRVVAGQPTSTTWDLAVLFNYGDGAAKKAGVVWEASGATKRFQFTTDINPGADGGPTDTNLPAFTVTSFAPIEISSLWINGCGSLGALEVIKCNTTEIILQDVTIDAGIF